LHNKPTGCSASRAYAPGPEEEEEEEEEKKKKKMYCNVPTNELLKIINVLCERHEIIEGLKEEIMKISQILIEQNYFQFQDTVYIQKEGFAVGAPTSSVFSKIHLQFIEYTKMFEVLLKHHIKGYFRYVNDSLIVHKEDKQTYTTYSIRPIT
jgi:hypothetical protein